MTAKDSQKPPYDERAVAPKVLPTAISLHHKTYQLPTSPRTTFISFLVPLIGIHAGNVPHARKQLNQTSIPKRQPDDDIRLRQSPCPNIDKTEHERRQRKSAQAQRRRVRKLSLRNALICTRLELSSKGGETSRLAGVDVRERSVAKARGSFGCFVLFVRHLAVCSVGVVGGKIIGGIRAAIVLFVGSVDVLAVELGGSHCGSQGAQMGSYQRD